LKKLRNCETKLKSCVNAFWAILRAPKILAQIGQN
jgi:hypothetical protein